MAQEIRYIPIDKIHPFCGKRYFALNPAKVQEYADSIRAVGILEPLIVRPDREQPEQYELIAGEHRLRAAELAGEDEVPAVVKEFTDAEAQLCYGETNRQREKISIMERAFMAYYDAMYGNGNQGHSDDISERHRRDLMRLTDLTSSMQQLVDAKQVSIKAGAAAAELPIGIQNQLYTLIVGSKRVLTEEIVKEIRRIYDAECIPYGKRISISRLEDILSEGQPRKVKKVHLAIDRRLLRKLPEEYRTKEAQEKLVEELLIDFAKKK